MKKFFKFITFCFAIFCGFCFVGCTPPPPDTPPVVVPGTGDGNNNNNNNNNNDDNNNNNNNNNTDVPSEEQLAFDALIGQISKLETLAKNYNSDDVQWRTSSFIRYNKYNTNEWQIVCGTLEEEFLTYVTQNQGQDDLFSLQTKQYFVSPITKEKVDFVHLIVGINSYIYKDGSEYTADLANWAGDIVQLASELTYTDLVGEQLDELVLQNFNTNTSGFNNQDVAADLDVLCIMDIYNNSTEKSISKAMQEYYSDMTIQSKKIRFKELVFGTSTVSKSQMQQTIKAKILDNFFLQMWANENNLNFTTHEHILDACIKAFVNYLG